MSEYELREMVDAWRSLRLEIDRREKELEDELKEDKQAVLLLESDIREALKKQGAKSIKFDGDGIPDYLRGTAFITHRFGCKVEDQEKFFNYVLRENAVELLFARANDTGVKEYIEAHKEPPPGITTSMAEKLSFRKAS